MTTKQFKWIDRDTAARDLLQLVYHAPGYLHEQALKLLEAIRSPAIILDLKAIVLDPEYDVRQRRAALDAIIATPGNFDFHEFESILVKVYDTYNAPFYAARLTKHHPVNLSWVLSGAGQWTPAQQFNNYLRLLPFAPQVAAEPLLKLLDENPTALELHIAESLHKHGGEIAQDWLRGHSHELIRLWLSYGIDFTIYDFGKQWRLRYPLDDELEKWPELKDFLRHTTPTQLLSCMEQENVSRQSYMCRRLLKYTPQVTADVLLKLLNENPGLLDLETAELLHRYGDESVQNWLRGQWDELLYLCLIDGIGNGIYDYAERMRLGYILESWSELKEALFVKCPAILDEYNQRKVRYEASELRPVSDSDIQELPIWKALEQRRDEWIEQEKEHSTYSTLNHTRSEDDIPLMAAEIYFLGTFPHPDNSYDRMLDWYLHESGGQWRDRVYLYMWDEWGTFLYSPIRFEAAYALRNIVTTRVWEISIETLFTPQKMSGATTSSMFERHLLRWIARLTDQLSGVEPEYPDEELPLNARPWFCHLVKASARNESASNQPAKQGEN